MSRPFHHFHVLAVVVILSAVTACGKKTDKTDAPGKTDPTKTSTDPQGGVLGDRQSSKTELKPCTILSQDELKKITGFDFTNTTPQGNVKALSNCDYFTADAKHNLGLGVARGSSGAKARIDGAKRSPNHKSIAGVGDEAVWVPIPGSLDVRKGDLAVFVRISQSQGDDETRIEKAKAIVKLMLERL